MSDPTRINFRMIEWQDERPKEITGDIKPRFRDGVYSAAIKITGGGLELALWDFTPEQLDTLQRVAASLAEDLKKHQVEGNSRT